MHVSPHAHHGHHAQHDHGGLRGFFKGLHRRQSAVPQETEVTRTNNRVETLSAGENGVSRTQAEHKGVSIEQSGFARERDFARSAKKLVRGALRSLAHDVGKVFKDLGLDAKAGKQLVKGFIKPLVSAIRQGIDFTAQLSFAAVQKTTIASGGAVAESLSLFAKSVDISVNHSTGEISVDVQSLSVEQQSLTKGAGAQAPAPTPFIPELLGPPLPAPSTPSAPAPVASPAPPPPAAEPPAQPNLLEVIERLTQSTAREALGGRGESAVSGGETPTEPVPLGEPEVFDPPIKLAVPSDDGGEATDGGEGTDGGKAVDASDGGEGDGGEGNAELGARLEAQRSEILLRAIQQLESPAGELITKLRLDAKISLSQVLQSEPRTLEKLAGAEFAAKLDFSA